jgi:hypothetical protein
MEFSYVKVNRIIMNNDHYLIPTQIEGLEKDMEHTITTKTVEDAEDWFVDAKERLLDVNSWKKISGIDLVDFKLTDAHGRPLSRRARKGDYIRIDVEGHGHEYDGGFHWAEIEAIEYDDYPDISMETFALRVRPSDNPANKNDRIVRSAFDDGPTSTFVIGRVGKVLSSHYHGRNEEADMAGVAMAGHAAVADVAVCAWLGLSDVECDALLTGFVE